MRLNKIVSGAISLVMVFAMAFPVSAFATVDDETYVATDEEVQQALATGVEGMATPTETLAEEEEADGSSTSDATSDSTTVSVMSDSTLEPQYNSGYKVASISGDSRYSTAAQAAIAAFPSGVSSKTAVVVNGDEGRWPDAITASSLAGALDCPILYSSTSSIPTATSDAISSLGITKVIIIGGEGSVSSDNASALQSLGTSITRLGGGDRYETQVAVYEYGAQLGIWNSSTAIVASGSSFPDALSIASLAYKEKMPIFLCTGDSYFDTSQIQALFSSSFSNFIIVGGDAAVPDAVEGFLRGVAAKTTGSDSVDRVTRLSGSNRYETSVNIAQWSVDNGYLVWDEAGFASGTNSADSLAGSVLQGKRGSVMLLLSSDNETTLYAASGKGITHVTVFGGKAAVSACTRNDIAYDLGFRLAQIEGFKIYVDAGHGQNNTGNGAYDSGATSAFATESVWNKKIADGIASYLGSMGFDYYLNDDGGPYWLRQAEAEALGCNVIISIHFNATGIVGAGTGSESLIHNENAEEWSSWVQNVMQPYLIAGTSLTDRGKKTQAVAILGGDLPAALFEVAFIDNLSDMNTVYQRQDTICYQLALGISQL